MMILDSPIDQNQNDLKFLQDPLIPLPIDINEIIYDCSIDSYPTERWRDYIDISKPVNPSEVHEEIMQRRIYALKTTYELAVMKSSVSDDWILKETLELLFNKTRIELRMVEFEMIGYQLICGMIKFQGKHDDMYHANINLYFTLLNLIKTTGKSSKLQTKLTNSVKNTTKPTRSQTFKSLALNIDNLITGIHKIVKNEFYTTSLELNNAVTTLSKQLTDCILALDKIIVVVVVKS